VGLAVTALFLVAWFGGVCWIFKTGSTKDLMSLLQL